MSEWVIYHNPDRMGYLADQIDVYSVVTNKRPKDIYGARVWLLTGTGKPRVFHLCAWFMADRVDFNCPGEFGTRITGTTGRFILSSSWPVLNAEPWFPAFKRSQGNFAFGLQRITDESIVRDLERLAKHA